MLSVQTSLSQEKGYGFKGGITLSYFYDNSLQSYSNFNVDFSTGAGLSAGAFVDMINNGNFVISSELYFNRKVASAKLVTDNPYIINILPKGGVDFHIDYLVYGTPFKYYLKTKNIKPYFYLEPRVNFFLGDNIKGVSDTISKSSSDIVSESLTRFGFGLSGGAGTEILLNKGLSLLFEIQFSPDLFDTYYSDDFSVRSNSLEFRTGLKFY